MTTLGFSTSDRWFYTSFPFNGLGVLSLLIALEATKGAGLLINIAWSVITLGLFFSGFAAYVGWFEKTEPPLPPKPEGFKPDPLAEEEKVKPAPKESWADKWIKDNE